MRISVDHRTRYRFTTPQARLVQLLRLTPQDSIDQTVVNWHIGVDCDVRLREARDGFGNRVTMLYADGPIAEIGITVEGEVLTASEGGLVRGVAEPLPPALFVRTTLRTIADEAMLGLMQDLPGGALERVHALNRAVHGAVECEEQHNDDGLTAAQAFAAGAASPRDFAHILLALARADGIPARYVSGYRPGMHGGHAPHAWAEMHVPGIGWLAVDPSRGIVADAHYVRVATALDASGAAAVAGSRLGKGEEQLDVDLQVEAIGAEA